VLRCITLLVLCAAVFVSTAASGVENRLVLGANPNLSQGAFELRSGNFEEGIRLTFLGLKESASTRDRRAAMNNLCAGYAALGRYDAAIHICNIILDKNERDWRAYNNRALAYMGAGDLDQAKADVDKGLAINPGSKKLRLAAELIDERLVAPRLKEAVFRW
jgi:tetratricopeptide (TPR) repeat protein